MKVFRRDVDRLWEVEHGLALLRQDCEDADRRVRDAQIRLSVAKDAAKVAHARLAAAEADADAKFPVPRRDYQ